MRLIKLIDGRYPVTTPADAGQPRAVEEFLRLVPADMQAPEKAMGNEHKAWLAWVDSLEKSPE